MSGVIVTVGAIAAGLPPTAGAQGTTCVKPQQLGVVLALDDSASMEDTDPAELRRLGAELALDQLPNGSIASALSFDSVARELFAPATVDASSRARLKGEISLDPSGGTNFELGFDLATAQLSRMPAAVDGKAVIFLSDGERNEGDAGTEERIAGQGIPVYTIGFGDANRSELSEIAEGDGRTGKSYFVDDAAGTQAAFADIVSRITCAVAKLEERATLNPGEVREFPFDVAPTDRGWTGLVTWSSGQTFDVSAARPNGSLLTATTANANEGFEVLTPTQRRLSALKPSAGRWRLIVSAAPGNSGPVDVDLRIFGRDDGQAIIPVPIVLVTGLGTDAAGKVPSEDCTADRVAGFVALCNRLREQGHSIWAVRATRTGPVISNRGRIDPNARRLAAYLRTLGTPSAPLLIGHSMGGLIARVAMARYKADAVGLVTLASPYQGSFLADLAVGGATIGRFCLLPACKAVQAASLAAMALLGPAAVQDLTSTSRSDDNAKLPPLGARKVWRVAGDVVSVPAFFSNSYIFPNDQVVARESALGDRANLGGELQTPLVGALWHARSLPPLVFVEHPDNVLESDGAIEYVRGAAEFISTPAGAAATRAAPRSTVQDPSTGVGGRPAPVAAAQSRRRVTRVVLTAASTNRLRPRKSISVLDSRSVMATKPFQLRCNGQAQDAIAVTDKLYGVFTSGCPRARVSAANATSIVRLRDVAKIRASVRTDGGKVRITFTSGRRSLRRVQARVGTRILRAKRQTARRWTLSLDRRSVRVNKTVLLASAGRLRYGAPLTLPR